MMMATLVFAVGMTILTIVIAFIVALALDKKGKGRINRGFLRSAWFFPTLLSGVVVGILWRTMYNYNNGVINKIIVACGGQKVNWLETVGLTNFAIIFGATWARIGICVVIFMAGLQAISQDLYEAASLDDEDKAIRNALDKWDVFGFMGGLLRVDGKIMAYTIAEELDSENLDVRFEKAFPEYAGSYQAINFMFLKNQGAKYKFVNREEDMGEPGLREAKESYNPILMLEKYQMEIL